MKKLHLNDIPLFLQIEFLNIKQKRATYLFPLPFHPYFSSNHCTNIHFYAFFHSKATRVILSATIVCNLLMMPMAIFGIVSSILDSGSSNDFTMSAPGGNLRDVCFQICMWMLYLNHSTNFFVYILAGRKKC